jgi:outer membrane protein OmpA-like peptidoglycan-associated protein
VSVSSRTKLPDFSHSMTDLMASIAVTFLLIAAIFMLRASQANSLAKATIDSAKQRHQRSRDAIKALTDELNQAPGLQGAVRRDDDDELLVTAEFAAKAIYFGTDEAELSGAARETLVPKLQRVVESVCAIPKELTNSIVLEGHSDPQGGYEHNVSLSARRAESVYFAVRDAVGGGATRDCIDSRFTVSGRGPVQPKVFKGAWNDSSRPAVEDRDRRVVLKVRFASGADNLVTDDAR